MLKLLRNLILPRGERLPVSAAASLLLFCVVAVVKALDTDYRIFCNIFPGVRGRNYAK
jgi:hypothetical protein